MRFRLSRLGELGGHDAGELGLHFLIFVGGSRHLQTLTPRMARVQREQLAKRDVVNRDVGRPAMDFASPADRVQQPAKTAVFF